MNNIMRLKSNCLDNEPRKSSHECMNETIILICDLRNGIL